MVEVRKEELKDLEYLGSGTFGSVYKKNDEVAYKIYHSKIPDERGIEMDNPCLFLSKRRFHTLMERSKDFKFTGGVLDTIRVDGHFGGVVLPFVKGDRLHDKKDLPISTRVKLAKQMVRNGKELTNHLVYPTDYKLNNIMYQDGDAEIIDLDDVRTHVSHVPNPIFHALSVSALNETICSFMNEFEHCPIPKEARKEIKSNHGKFALTYHKINDYLDDKGKERHILFVDDQTDLDQVQKTLRYYPYDVVYILPVSSSEFPDKEEFLKRIDRCHQYGIFLYDFVKEDRLDTYDTMVMAPVEFYFDQEDIKVYKKTIQ